MEWARETRQQTLILKIDFDKAYDWVDWYFIYDMLICLGFGPRCVSMMNIMFINALAFVLVNKALSPRIYLHHSIFLRMSFGPLFICLWYKCFGLFVRGFSFL
jgi:hypothetical protein